MPCFLLERPLTGWRREARRGKKHKARSRNSPHPSNETLRGGQSSIFSTPFQKGEAISEAQDDHWFKRQEERMKPAEVHCQQDFEMIKVAIGR